MNKNRSIKQAIFLSFGALVVLLGVSCIPLNLLGSLIPEGSMWVVFIALTLIAIGIWIIHKNTPKRRKY